MAGERIVKIKFTGDAKGLVASEAVAETAMERFQKKVKKSADNMSILKTSALTLGPALLPILAVSTGAAIGLGSALLSAGAAMGVFGAVTASAFGEVKTAAGKTDALREKVRLLGEQIKVARTTGIGDAGKLEKAQANATNELIARYNLMPPALRKVTMAYDGMKSKWQSFVDSNKPAVYDVLGRGFTLIGNSIGKLQPLFDIGFEAASRLLRAFTGLANGGGLTKFIKWLTINAGPALANLGTIGKNVGIFLVGLFKNFAPAGQGFLSWLAVASETLAKWSTNGGLQQFLAYVTANGPKVGALLASVAQAAVHIAQAVSPLAPISLAVAGALTAIINALPLPVITALAAAWVAYSVALTGYNVVVGIVSAATTAWTAIQWLLNVALTANPIGLIIVGIAALIAIIVLIATKTTWFQTAWKVAWGAIKTGASAVGSWFKDTLWGSWIKGSFDAIVKKGSDVVGWFKAFPGRLKSALLGVANYLTAPFFSAFNSIAHYWNSTVGRLSFTTPDWIPGMGGKSWAMPNLPERAMGGPVMAGRSYLVGERGPEVLTMGAANGNITPNHALDSGPDILQLDIDLGEGIHQVVQINLRDHDRKLKRRTNAAGAMV